MHSPLRRVRHASATAEGSSEGLQYCMALPHPTSSPRHGFQLKQKPTSTQTCTQLFKQPKCVSGGEWINKPWWTHTVKHCSTIRNKPLIITARIQPNMLQWAGKNKLHFLNSIKCTVIKGGQKAIQRLPEDVSGDNWIVGRISQPLRVVVMEMLFWLWGWFPGCVHTSELTTL